MRELDYDDVNRLVSTNVTYGTVQNFSYTYDRYGNRWQQSVTAGSGPQFSVSFNRATNQINSSGYSYDAAGNMTSDSFHSYAYDADGNVTTVDGGATEKFTYNALNQRVRIDQGSTAIEFVFDQKGKRVSFWDGHSYAPLRGSYYWGTMPVAYYTSNTHFQHLDYLGTARLQTDYSGAVEGTYLSLSWGDGFTDSGSGVYGNGNSADDAYHFAALDHDYESFTDHAQFREYSPTQGRWLSPDPYDGSYDFSNPQSFNRYAYVLNNPLTATDPSGQDGCTAPIATDPATFAVSCTGSVIGDAACGPLCGEVIGDIAGGIAAGLEAIFGFGGPSFHGSLQPRPSAAPNNNPCANSTLSAAGVTAQGQIATAQGFIAAGQIGANSTPYANPVLGFFGGMFGYYEAVHTGGPNDIKNQLGPGYHNQIGVDAGNISYGITCPYGAGFCQFAAGTAQTLSGDPNPNGTLSTGFDTPSDNASIRQGQAMRAAGCHE